IHTPTARSRNRDPGCPIDPFVLQRSSPIHPLFSATDLRFLPWRPSQPFVMTWLLRSSHPVVFSVLSLPSVTHRCVGAVRHTALARSSALRRWYRPSRVRNDLRRPPGAQPVRPPVVALTAQSSD